MSSPAGFATLDRANPLDPVEGYVDQFVIEFRDAAGEFIERIHGTRLSCFSDAARRGYPPSQVRITGRAQQ
jgi:hypothetical protein